MIIRSGVDAFQQYARIKTPAMVVAAWLVHGGYGGGVSVDNSKVELQQQWLLVISLYCAGLLYFSKREFRPNFWPILPR